MKTRERNVVNITLKASFFWWLYNIHSNINCHCNFFLLPLQHKGIIYREKIKQGLYSILLNASHGLFFVCHLPHDYPYRTMPRAPTCARAPARMAKTTEVRLKRK